MISSEDIIKKVETKRQEALEFLQECIRTPSVTGDEAAMGQVVTKWIEGAGLHVDNYEKEQGRPNLVAEWKGTRDGRRFVFNSHLDVFPPVEGKPGKYGPWSGVVEDGWIYGRGTVDMKAGLCAGVLAVKYLKEMGFDPAGSVLLTCVSDEESMGYKGVRHLLEKGLIKGDFGVCTECTRCKMLVEHGGFILVEVTFSSESGHTSAPHPSEDALTKGIKAVQKLQELNKEIMKNYNEEMKAHSLLTVTVINSGKQPNMYPSTCKFIIGRRLIPGEKVDEENARMRKALDELQMENPHYDYTYDYNVQGSMECLVVDPEEEIVKIGREAYRDITGEENLIYKRGGGSDAATIMAYEGIPMPNFGPGNDVEESTNENEHLYLEEFYTFIKVYMMMVVKALS